MKNLGRCSAILLASLCFASGPLIPSSFAQQVQGCPFGCTGCRSTSGRCPVSGGDARIVRVESSDDRCAMCPQWYSSHEMDRPAGGAWYWSYRFVPDSFALITSDRRYRYEESSPTVLLIFTQLPNLEPQASCENSTSSRRSSRFGERRRRCR